MPLFLLLLLLILNCGCIYVYCVLIRACLFFSGSSEFTATSQPYGQVEASIREFVEDGLHTSEAVTDEENSGILCGNRMFGPQSIRHQSSRGFDSDLLHQPPARVLYPQLKAMCSAHIRHIVLL